MTKLSIALTELAEKGAVPSVFQAFRNSRASLRYIEWASGVLDRSASQMSRRAAQERRLRCRGGILYTPKAPDFVRHDV